MVMVRVDGHFPPITKKTDDTAVRGPGGINTAQTLRPAQKVTAMHIQVLRQDYLNHISVSAFS